MWIGLVLSMIGGVCAQFNNPPGVNIWCGKAYKEGTPSFDPGGQLSPPGTSSPLPFNQTRISIHVYPQYAYYTPSDKTATILVDTPVSRYAGTYPFKNGTWENSTSVPITELHFWMSNALTGKVLANWVRVPINETGIQVKIALDGIQTDYWPTLLTVIVNSPDGIQTFYATSTITVLPEAPAERSMARIDRIHGGLYVRSKLTKDFWKPIFPYSFYTSWDWISSTLTDPPPAKNLATFRAAGYNLIHPVPPGGSEPFDADLLEKFLSECDRLELYVMYDMRHTYQNRTSVAAQLARLQFHPSLLLYYTADEPDGACDPLNATALAYEQIHSIDPYHSVSLVLNCQNFYFAEYTAGADIILEDTYPIIKSASFSPVYNTPCNATYGDCGCDNCHANDPAFPAYVANPFRDISERIDSMYAYQEWIRRPAGPQFRKPVWGVPQAFFDDNSFWSRWPTAAEEAVMALLRVNHGAKGIVAWIYPTKAEIEEVTGKLARVLGREDVTVLLLGAEPKRLEWQSEEGTEVLDGAVWTGDDEMLIILLNLGKEKLTGPVSTVLPVDLQGEPEVLYGYSGWTVGYGGTIVTDGLDSLSASVLKAKIKKG